MSDTLPRLMLVSPRLDEAAAAAAFAAALAEVAEIEVAALLLRGGGLGDADLSALTAPVIAAAQGRGIAVLLEDRPALVAESGADGLHVTLAGKGSPLKDLRRRFGDSVILGAGCGASRHLAMTAGEQGADYIGFGSLDSDGRADPDIVAWWEAVMTPPQVAFGAESLDDAVALAAAGPDFLAVSPALWLAQGGPAAALRQLLAALPGEA
ncbi:MAG: thiamine phosphate synthase [Kiloniellaceae bacterium]